MEFSYLKLLAANKIQETDLPNDVRIGIKSIKGQQKAIHMVEKGGKTVKQSAIDKITREDKNVTREIQEWFDEKNKGVKTDTSSAKNDADEKEDKVNTDLEVTKHKGIKVDSELEPLFKSGKTSLTLEEIKSSAPTAYNVIFDAYEKDGENGLHTSRYSLIESSEKEKFTISKK